MSKKKQDDKLNKIKPRVPNQVLNLILPIPISENHAYIYMRRGGKRLNKKAEQWMATAKHLAEREVEATGWYLEDCGVWFTLEMKVFMPDRRIRDSHNMYKILMDALEGTVYRNDYYVMTRTKSVQLDRERPRVELTIKPVKR